MIDQSKLKIVETKVDKEMDCLTKTLNINNLIDFYNSSNNEEIKKYRKKKSSNILFSNKVFLRILYINIYIKYLVPYCHKRLVEINREYPNDYFCIENIKSIDICTEVIMNNKNKIYEELLTNSIKIFHKYKFEYLFDFMETTIFNLENNKNNCFRYFLSKNKINPYMLLEDNNSVLYFDSGIFYINIETGKTKYHSFDELSTNYYFCFLENNKFIIYNGQNMIVYKYENDKMNKIFTQNFENNIDNIFKLFKGEYILIKINNIIKIFYESDLKYIEYFNSGLKCIEVNSVTYFGDKKVNYFSAKEDNKNLLLKISLNSKNEIVFDKEYLPIHNVVDYIFIAENKLFLLQESRKKKYNIVYDLNYKQVEMVFEYKEKNCLKNIFKGIQGINIGLLKDFLYETNRQNNYVLKRNNNEIYFITKKGFDNIFKVFKYTLVQTNLTPNLYKK
jgi:hypothetical protein